MKFRQTIILTLLLFKFSFSFGQSKDNVFLQWKIYPNDTLKYELISRDLDTSDRNNNRVDLSGFFKSFNDTSKLSELPDSLKIAFSDSIKILQQKMSDPSIMEKFNKNLGQAFKIRGNGNDTLLITATNKNKNIVDIEMSQPPSTIVMLRGAVYDNGNIQSFFIKSPQKNLIALYFELPNKVIKVGDTWSLDINLISMDQNFKCDSSYKLNKVTFSNIKRKSNETVAVIDYDIEEYVTGDFYNQFAGNTKIRTTIKFKYNATGEFSIDKGKWLSYNGTQSIYSSGFSNSKTNKKFSLILQ